MSDHGGVLIGLDGSERDWPALDWAAAEAAALGAGLTVVHVGDPRPAPDRVTGDLPAGDRRQTRDVIDAAVGRVNVCASGVAVKAWRVDGDPVPELLRLAEASDRVVLGALRGCGSGGPLRGSVPAQVAAKTSRTSVLVRGRPDPSGPIVVGVDGTVNDDVVLPYAFAYALRHRIPLRALHAYRAVVASAAGQVYAYLPHEDAAALVETAVGRWARVYPEVLVECMALPGSAAQRLIEVSTGSSLVVVGWGGRSSRLPAAVRRPVGMALARRSRCPVVLAR